MRRGLSTFSMSDDIMSSRSFHDIHLCMYKGLEAAEHGKAFDTTVFLPGLENRSYNHSCLQPKRYASLL